MPTDRVARPLVAAGALFTDPAGHDLLVRPTYKGQWEIPGGAVEPGESPRAACEREVAEELGIRPPIGDLLVVDWAPAADGDRLLFVFDGGVLGAERLGDLVFADGEISEARHVPPERLAEYTVDRLVRRLRVALDARSLGRPLYAEHGRPAVGR